MSCNKTVKQLQAMAVKANITGRSKMNKQQLCRALGVGSSSSKASKKGSSSSKSAKKVSKRVASASQKRHLRTLREESILLLSIGQEIQSDLRSNKTAYNRFRNKFTGYQQKELDLNTSYHSNQLSLSDYVKQLRKLNTSLKTSLRSAARSTSSQSNYLARINEARQIAQQF